jgi:hypothetical protein
MLLSAEGGGCYVGEEEGGDEKGLGICHGDDALSVMLFCFEYYSSLFEFNFSVDDWVFVSSWPEQLRLLC